MTATRSEFDHPVRWLDVVKSNHVGMLAMALDMIRSDYPPLGHLLVELEQKFAATADEEPLGSGTLVTGPLRASDASRVIAAIAQLRHGDSSFRFVRHLTLMSDTPSIYGALGASARRRGPSPLSQLQHEFRTEGTRLLMVDQIQHAAPCPTLATDLKQIAQELRVAVVVLRNDEERRRGEGPLGQNIAQPNISALRLWMQSHDLRTMPDFGFDAP